MNLAAKDIGVSQPTLARIVSGGVTSPRTIALQKISDYYGATVDWLLTGVGEPPAAFRGTQDGRKEHPNVRVRWMLMVNRLKLPGDVAQALLNQPYHAATLVWLIPSLLPANETTQAALQAAIDREHEAWIALLDAASLHHGEESLAKLLSSQLPVLRRLLPSAVSDKEWAALHKEARASAKRAKAPSSLRGDGRGKLRKP